MLTRPTVERIKALAALVLAIELGHVEFDTELLPLESFDIAFDRAC